MKDLIHDRVERARLLGCGLALGWALAHGPALAADDKIFAPQSCRPLGSGPVFGEISPADIRFDGAVVCPLVRDQVTGTLNDVWVRLDDLDMADDGLPLCCVHSVSLGGALQDFECEEAPNDTEQVSLRFELENFTEVDHGHYAVTCELGNEAILISIRTSESP